MKLDMDLELFMIVILKHVLALDLVVSVVLIVLLNVMLVGNTL